MDRKATITIARVALAEALNAVGKASAERTTLPILASVLLFNQEFRLKVSATDLEVGLTAWENLESYDGSFQMALPAKTLTDMVNTLTDSNVELQADYVKMQVVLKSGGFKATIKGLDAQEFPPMPEFDGSGDLVGFDLKAFKQDIASVIYCASKDDSRPVLKGVMIDLGYADGFGIIMAATDGFRLVELKRPTDAGKRINRRAVIIPADSFRDFARIAKSGEVELQIIGVNHVIIRAGNIELVSQLIDGNFPDYRQIVPKKFTITSQVDRSELIQACRQASVIARDGNSSVRLCVQPSQIGVVAQAEQTGALETNVTANTVFDGGENLDITFNVNFLREALESMTTKNVFLRINAVNTPMMITPEGDEDYTCVLMPLYVG